MRSRSPVFLARTGLLATGLRGDARCASDCDAKRGERPGAGGDIARAVYGLARGLKMGDAVGAACSASGGDRPRRRSLRTEPDGGGVCQPAPTSVRGGFLAGLRPAVLSKRERGNSTTRLATLLMAGTVDGVMHRACVASGLRGDDVHNERAMAGP